ncbi:MAG: hypothetical protein O9284_01370 [Steroidobacteraceae bacterium]|nr:hypothetical protein [Steroidobacteraceae bacterium]
MHHSSRRIAADPGSLPMRRAVPPREPGRDPEDLQRTLADLAALAQSVTLAVHELGRVGGRLRGAADELGQALGEAWDVARAHGGGAFSAVDGRLFRKPYVAVAAAIAIGALAGYALRRSGASWRARGPAHEPDDGWDHFV